MRVALPKILNAPLQLPHVASSPSKATRLPLSNIVDVTAMRNPPVVVESLSLAAVLRIAVSFCVKESKTFAGKGEIVYGTNSNLRVIDPTVRMR